MMGISDTYGSQECSRGDGSGMNEPDTTKGAAVVTDFIGRASVSDTQTRRSLVERSPQRRRNRNGCSRPRETSSKVLISSRISTIVLSRLLLSSTFSTSS